jgi:surfactin synthase thioesterase subunit
MGVRAGRQQAGATTRLFCVPYAGGQAVAYRPWSARLPATIELRALELPGQGSRLREPPLSDAAPLADELAAAIAPHAAGPYALFGHSVGALLAFETARRLEAAGRPPLHVFVAAHRAPSLALREPPLHLLGDAELRAALARYNGTPRAVLEDDDLMRLFLPGVRAGLAVSETYVLRDPAPLACPLTAFAGTRDERVPVRDVAVWRAHASGPFALHRVDGDHFFPFRDDAVVAAVTAALCGSPSEADLHVLR